LPLTEIEGLVKAYERFVKLPWDQTLPGPKRVWFAIYEPTQERRLRLRLDEFAVVTRNAGKQWEKLDLTDSFATWMAAQEYRDAYFEQPEDMELALEDFADFVVEEIKTALSTEAVDQNTVIAIVGLASLFGLARASAVFERVTTSIRGRLLVFFPGNYEGSNYRLLDARDGWNYLAVPITPVVEK
jgi:hypothetical protein